MLIQKFLIAGFIDFIVSPSLEVCGDMLDRVLNHLESHKDGVIAEDSTSKISISSFI